MAEPGIADFTKQVTGANLALKGKFNKSLSLTYVRVAALSKAFGPFYDIWLKLKPAVGAIVKPLMMVLGPLKLIEKTADGVKLTFFGIIGVLMTFIAFFALLG